MISHEWAALAASGGIFGALTEAYHLARLRIYDGYKKFCWLGSA